jgi:2-amino-4-hydroxy-6-hydroxymethyldihydropteridine diphosphokinase
VLVVIGFGGNIGDVERAFMIARDRLSRRWSVNAVSRLYVTRPVGPEQPDFLNSAVLLRCDADLSEILRECRDAEHDAGRNRDAEEHWGPRVLDLDVLIARDVVRRGPSLKVPHARFHQRAFTVIPTADVAGEWRHPFLGRTVSQLAADLPPDQKAEVVAVDSTRWMRIE